MTYLFIGLIMVGVAIEDSDAAAAVIAALILTLTAMCLWRARICGVRASDYGARIEYPEHFRRLKRGVGFVTLTTSYKTIIPFKLCHVSVIVDGKEVDCVTRFLFLRGTVDKQERDARRIAECLSIEFVKDLGEQQHNA